MNFLKKFYRGQYSLVKTFWLYGLIPLSIYAGLLAVAESKGVPSIALNAVKIPGLIYTLLWMAGAWQSAKKYEGWEVWKLLAQAYIFLAIVGGVWAVTASIHHAVLLITEAFSVPTSNAVPATMASEENASAIYDRGDYATAFRLYRQLADQGDSKAKVHLGLMWEQGQGVPKDYAEAAKWYGDAAESKYAPAQDMIGRMYANGEFFSKDETVAVGWYRMSADQGFVPAFVDLGSIYFNGQGVPQDYTEAMKWYRKAADQGDATGQSDVGTMYYMGYGVPKDYAEAAKWFELAATQGDVKGQFTLGIMYEQGWGVPQDYVQAHMWYSLATIRFLTSQAQMRDATIGMRDRLATKMTPEQIAEAQRLASEWKQK